MVAYAFADTGAVISVAMSNKRKETRKSSKEREKR